MDLYAHQQKIVDEDKPYTGIFTGTGSGKTRIALRLAEGDALVVAPKTQKEDRNWERELLKMSGLRLKALTVMSREEFKKASQEGKLPYFDTVIVDEAHMFLGATPNIRYVKKKAIPKTSQIYEELGVYVMLAKPKRLYLCTATIIRTPMTVWAAALLLYHASGNEEFNWNFYEFREAFYIRLPMPGREVWAPRNDSDTKDRLARAVQKLGYTGQLSDYFDVPAQTYKTVHVPLTVAQQKRLKEIPLEYPDPLVLLTKRHQVEQGVLAGDEFNPSEDIADNKIEAILDILLEFPRIIVFAKYRAQIAKIEARLSKEGKTVITMTGDTKERGGVISKAQGAKECVFLCQAQISAGWELPNYPVMVFASMSYSVVDRVQAEGRILRANALKKNLYIDLIVKGGIDEAVQKSILNKKDFNERIYLDL